MPAEPIQEQGREGARRAKRWLDSTSKVRIEWDVYHSAALTTITRPDGSTQLFDLRGHIYMGGPAKPLFVEAKQYTDAGGQGPKYKEFMADAYFGTLQYGAESETQFMWVSWHPFNLSGWKHMTGPMALDTPGRIEHHSQTTALVKEAVEASGHAGDTPVSDSICALVARRLWLVVLSDQQESHLTLDDEVADQVREEIRRRSTL